MVIGLLTDPGLPENVAQRVADDISRDLDRAGDDAIAWRIEVSRLTLPLTRDGDIPLMQRAPGLRDDNGWDYLVYLTDLPLTHDGQSLLCEASTSARATLIMLPAAGVHRLDTKIRRLIVALMQSLQSGTQQFPSVSAVRRALGYGPVQRISSPTPDDDISYLVLPGRRNQVRLLLGMIRNNRPFRLLPALSRCMAVAVATGAFGIFYATIWAMADAMMVTRLATISVLVIVALSTWLILHNGLWNRRGTDANERWRAELDNAATIVTVGLGLTMMYVVIWAILFVAGVAVITPDYLESQLDHPVGPLDYVQLSWLAASMGTMAGALGANFDSEEAIREATYSRRRYERRRLADADEA